MLAPKWRGLSCCALDDMVPRNNNGIADGTGCYVVASDQHRIYMPHCRHPARPITQQSLHDLLR